jgi:Arc/MetJ family transcription regulator
MMSVLMRRNSVRTTVTLDDAILARAAELTGIKETSALVRDGLETLIRVESGWRSAASSLVTPSSTRYTTFGHSPISITTRRSRWWHRTDCGAEG